MNRTNSINKLILLLAVFPAISAALSSRCYAEQRLEFSLPDIFGRQVHSQDYAGVPVFLEFGACW